MDQLDSVVVFSIFFMVLVLFMVLVYFFNERNKKKATENRFRAFRKGHTLSCKDLRAVPRISVPESMEVILTLKQGQQLQRVPVADISLSSLSVKANFSLKKMAVDSMINEVRIDTAINHFNIKALKLVRKEKNPRGQVVAFSIQDVEENQFEELKTFLKYLDEFLNHE